MGERLYGTQSDEVMKRIDYTKYGIDEKLKAFTKRLCPDSKLPFVGISTKKLRQIAKEVKEEVYITWTEDVILNNIILADSKLPFEKKTAGLEKLLPYYSSWIMTDSLACNLKLKKGELDEAYSYIKELTQRDGEYVKRTGVVLMLSNYLKPEYIDDVLSLFNKMAKDQESFTLQMALAWAFCTAMTKDREKTFKALYGIDKKILKLTAQKCRNSRRLSAEEKNRITLLSNS